MFSYRNIAMLPEEWPEDGDEDRSKLEKFGESKRSGPSTARLLSLGSYLGIYRYQQLQARLVALNAKRQAQEDQLVQYKQLQQLLEPFKDPQTNVQPNLVTKDGELGKELDRMRILMARVSHGMQGLKKGSENTDRATEKGMGRSTEEKLAGVMGM